MIKNNSYKSIYEKITTAIPKEKMSMATKEEIVAFTNDLVKDKKYTTIRSYLNQLNIILREFGNENSLSMKDLKTREEKTKTIVTKEVIDECVDMLENPQDKFILYSLFNGISGSQTSEIRNIKVKDIDLEEGTITVGDRVVHMDKKFKKITKETIEQDVYYKMDLGNEIQRDSFQLNMDNEYVLKPSIVNRATDSLSSFSHNGMRTRFYNILAYVDKNFSIDEVIKSGYAYRMNLENKDSWTVQAVEKWIKENHVRANADNLLKLYNKLYK